MASTYTPLGVEKMATGENAGTWGTKTNTNLEIIEQFAGGYTAQAVTDGADTDLSVTDGGTGATLAHRVIELTGALTGARNVTIPIDVQQMYAIKNSTTGSQAVTFKYVSGTGTSVTWAGGDTTTKFIYGTGSGTNPNLVDMGFGDVTTTGTQTLTNKTLTSPKIGTSILDTNGNELFLLNINSIAGLIPDGIGIPGDINEKDSATYLAVTPLLFLYIPSIKPTAIFANTPKS